MGFRKTRPMPLRGASLKRPASHVAWVLQFHGRAGVQAAHDAVQLLELQPQRGVLLHAGAGDLALQRHPSATRKSGDPRDPKDPGKPKEPGVRSGPTKQGAPIRVISLEP